MKYRADIDGLRALAVLAVVLGHLGVSGIQGGYVGVDIFFVISGFLITNFLIERSSTVDAKISLREFYFRRARRILPMALVVLAATSAAAWLLFNETKAAQVATDSYWAALFLANVHLIQQSTDYFNQAFSASPVQHYWSLAVEEQFYLFFPLIMIVTIAVAKRMRAKTSPFIWVVAALTAGSLAVAIVQAGLNASIGYFSSATRAYELGLGALLALAASRRLPALTKSWRSVVGFVGLGLMLGAVLTFSASTPFPSFWALLPTLGAVLFIYAGLPTSDGITPAGMVNRFFALKPIVFIGKISFSIYLIHWPLLTFWQQIDPGAPSAWWWLPANLGITLTLAVLGYRFIEQPFRRFEIKPLIHGAWMTGRGLIATVLAVALLGGSAYAMTGGTFNTAYQRPADSGDSGNQFKPNPDDGQALPEPNESASETPEPSATPTDGPSATPKPTKKPTEPSTEPTDEPEEPPVDPTANEPTLQSLLDAWKPKVQAATLITKVPDALDPPISQLLNQRGVQWSECMDPGYHQATCIYGPMNAKKTAVILGDSYALAIYPMVIAALGTKDWKIVGLNRRECMVADITPWPWSGNVPDVKCVEHREWVNSYIERTKPNLVILSDQPFHPIAEGNKKATENHLSIWEDGLDRALANLTQLSNNVVYFGVPTSAKGLVDCVKSGGVLSELCTGQSATFQRYTKVQETLSGNYYVPFIDPNDWLCFTGDCPAIIDNTPVFWDGSHFSQNLAAGLGPLFRAFLIENDLI